MEWDIPWGILWVSLSLSLSLSLYIYICMIQGLNYPDVFCPEGTILSDPRDGGGELR